MKRALNVVFFTVSSIVLSALTSGCVVAPVDDDPATEHAATEHAATEHAATEHVATEHVATEHVATAAAKEEAPMNDKETLPDEDDGPGGGPMAVNMWERCSNGLPPLCMSDEYGIDINICICP